jgi:hypothetical protein
MPERWGSPLFQEKCWGEMACDRREQQQQQQQHIIIIIIIIIITIIIIHIHTVYPNTSVMNW